MKLDVIIPCYNEEGNLALLYDKLCESLEGIKFNLIFINDGSRDKTFEILSFLYKKDKKRIKVINFSRNFGKDAAIYAGFEHSTAKYACVIDADLQQNPKYLVEMLTFLEENPEYDQVAMVNKDRSNDKGLTKNLKRTFYKVINKLSDVEFQENVSDFRMFNRRCVEAIISLSEANRFSKGIFSWVGFKTHCMDYVVEERHTGTSNFNLKSSFKYAFNGIINFSTKPLRLATIVGSISSLFSFVYFIILLLKTLIAGSSVPGYPSIVCLILFFGGLNLLAIGIMGEYIAKMYIEVKDRPVYIAKDLLGFEDDVL